MTNENKGVKPPHAKYGICAIASPLEANYIDEWIAYHKKIGIERFFICTNDWTWNISDPAVVMTRLDGREKQLLWYTWFTRNMGKYVDFCAFIDCDEFIKLGAKHKSFADLAEEHLFDDAFCLSWRMFGSSGLHFNGDYSVLKRFTHRQAGFNQHIKTVLNIRKLASFKEDKVVQFANPHFARIASPYFAGHDIVSYSVDGRRIYGPFDRDADKLLHDDDAWLAHYFTKTPEEWQKKKERGRIDVSSNSPLLFRNDSEFKLYDLNDVEDKSLAQLM